LGIGYWVLDAGYGLRGTGCEVRGVGKKGIEQRAWRVE
jgi:hypothetical protein